MPVANLMCGSQASRQLLVVFALLADHFLRPHAFFARTRPLVLGVSYSISPRRHLPLRSVRAAVVSFAAIVSFSFQAIWVDLMNHYTHTIYANRVDRQHSSSVGIFSIMCVADRLS
jgi:hypothetical protein